MFAEEWPLLTFTLLTQLAVGSYVFFVIIRSLNKKLGNNLGMKVTKRGILLVGPVMVLALLCSIFHLGTPLGANRSILNLGSSWLSREIIFSGGFFVLWVVSYYLDRKNTWNQVVGWITSIVGIGAVFCMASIYAHSIRPAWTNVNTYIAFYGTSIVFGAAVSIGVILFNKGEITKGLMSVVKGIGYAGLAAIVLQLIYTPIYVAGLSNGGAAGIESAGLLTGKYATTTLFRWILSIGGLAIIVLPLYWKINSKIQCKLFYAALTFVLVGEFLGRYIFYGTGISIGIGY